MIKGFEGSPNLHRDKYNKIILNHDISFHDQQSSMMSSAIEFYNKNTLDY